MCQQSFSSNQRAPLRTPPLPPIPLPEGVVGGVSALAAPVLQLDAQAVVALAGQQVERLVAQPVLAVRVAEAASVVSPAAVEAHRAVATPLEHRPGAP